MSKKCTNCNPLPGLCDNCIYIMKCAGCGEPLNPDRYIIYQLKDQPPKYFGSVECLTSKVNDLI